MNAPLGPSSRSLLARLLIRSREYRHPGFWMRVRIACGIFNLCLGVFLVSLGFWEGVLALKDARRTGAVKVLLEPKAVAV